MGLLFLLLIAGTIFLLVRQGKLEAEAKSILSERFARGELSTDEFMERASVLNWTPGTESWETWKPLKKS